MKDGENVKKSGIVAASVLAAALLAIASPATYAWTDIVSGPYVETAPHYLSHTFYVSGVWPTKGKASAQAHMECVQDNSFEDRFRGSCQSIATFDGPAVIALVSAQNHYWSAYADPDTNTAVRKAMALCHKDKAEECQLTNIYWDFGHNFLDAPESFKQLYMKLHDGEYWRPLKGYWVP
ncbi:hypothetical protein D0U02_00445 [Burkholderia pseudomallei]|uniref:Exported protein n=1 Tax=Burkholderia pseudomallei (strain K96243) TaxID=272560 RepID=Q63XH8_BURPS|nr:hypothetical protein D0U05_02255 [Burkholderia pseudomallei]RFS67430.1 hypothetical protein D0U02_00445 [Burkholderia pseudomallei]RFS72159.1 hypothetical protein D0U01_01025 [Burkholderia pseudomallei]RFS76028.1 hypothetical protein D0T98_00445 [Burkholderia pseudomallei]CAH34551.1 putative exported protein [Burkholderia pseudomallei K96243]